MSVKTTADEKLEDARHHVQQALESLEEIVVKKCHGSENFGDEFSNKLVSHFTTLLGIRNNL